MSVKNIVFLIDIQNGFARNDLSREQGGSLYVPEGERVGAPAAAMIKELSDTVFVLSQDYHPANHISFAANHNGFSEYSDVLLKTGSDGRYKVVTEPHPDALTQKLWPVHCVQGSESCLFVPEIMAALPDSLRNKLLAHTSEPLIQGEGDNGNAFYVVRKGMRCDLDSYGVSTENNGSSKTQAPALFTTLAGSFARNGVKSISIGLGGLATNFCVEFSNRDVWLDFIPLLKERGISTKVSLLTDISRGVPIAVPDGSWPDLSGAQARMARLGSKLGQSRDFITSHQTAVAKPAVA